MASHLLSARTNKLPVTPPVNSSKGQKVHSLPVSPLGQQVAIQTNPLRVENRMSSPIVIDEDLSREIDLEGDADILELSSQRWQA